MQKTVFGMFETYAQAEAGVQELLGRGFDLDELNVITLKSTIENSGKVNEREVRAELSSKAGQEKMGGLERLIGGKQPVRVAGFGDIISAGTLATEMIRNAAPASLSGEGLREIFLDFDVPWEASRVFQNGIKGGEVLVFVRTRDERAAIASHALSDLKGKQVEIAGDRGTRPPLPS